jgi:MerR family transcriptional regulator, aldehyde-responsive regulator
VNQLILSIKEASERLGIPPHTIRFYERKGLLPFLQRDSNGNRMFEQKDLEWINLLMWFRATGMTVADLKQFVQLAVQGESTIPQRQALLERHKLELQKRQLELDKAFEAVNQKLSNYEAYQQEKKSQTIGIPH